VEVKRDGRANRFNRRRRTVPVTAMIDGSNEGAIQPASAFAARGPKSGSAILLD
jgi:hypothetical protein